MNDQDREDISRGFITPDGQQISIDDVERMSSYIAGRHEDPAIIVEFLCSIAQECLEYDRPESAFAYFEKAMEFTDAPEERARGLLYMGLIKEGTSEYAAAIEIYRRAFAMTQEPGETWYFLNNNLGYCLNQEGRFAEAEAYCRAAIRIDPERHNAYKNLGVTLQGIGRHVEAARSFVHAARVCPADTRALGHLEQLLAAHPEVFEQAGDLAAQLMECREAIQSLNDAPSIQ